MRKNTSIFSVVSIVGVIAFIVIVVLLHVLQPGYNPVEQLISELADGPHGSAMFFAFLSLAIALASLAFGLFQLQTPIAIPICLSLASVCFIGAGIFRLGTAAETHIAFVAVAFFFCVLAMYLLPRTKHEMTSVRNRVISWGLAVVVASGVVSGGSLIPVGIAQRIIVGALLVWIIIFASRLFR